MDQEHEEILKKAYLTRGAIEIFEEIKKDIFYIMKGMLPPLGAYHRCILYTGLCDIQKRINEIDEMIALDLDVPNDLLKTTVESMDRITESFLDGGDYLVWEEDFTECEQFEMKMKIILEQAYKAIESLCHLIKPEITEIDEKKC